MPEATRELFIAAYDSVQIKPKRLLSYRINFLPQEPSMDISAGKAYIDKVEGNDVLRPVKNPFPCPLVLVDRTVAPAHKLPRLPFSLTNSGRMLWSRNSGVICFSLFDTSEQPVNSFKLDGVITPEDMSPIAACVDPWSGAIAVLASGRIRVFNL